MVMFPLTFLSNAFVPTDTMPGWLQTFADAQPGLPHHLGDPRPGQRRRGDRPGRLGAARLRGRRGGLRARCRCGASPGRCDAQHRASTRSASARSSRPRRSPYSSRTASSRPGAAASAMARERLPGHHRERPVVAEALAPGRAAGRRARGPSSAVDELGRRGPPAPSPRPGSRRRPSDRSWCRSDAQDVHRRARSRRATWAGCRRIADAAPRASWPRASTTHGSIPVSSAPGNRISRIATTAASNAARAASRRRARSWQLGARTERHAGTAEHGRLQGHRLDLVEHSSARSRSPVEHRRERHARPAACIASSIGMQPRQERDGRARRARRPSRGRRRCSAR